MWRFFVIIEYMRKIIKTQFFILLGGTIFAWTNFFIELNSWLNNGSCTVGCSANTSNPFLAPCFWGAVFFAIAFGLSVIILKKALKNR